MDRTNKKKCRSCKYSTAQSNALSLLVCNYYLMTGKRRGCEIGYCDKYEPKKRGR